MSKTRLRISSKYGMPTGLFLFCFGIFLFVIFDTGKPEKLGYFL
jgi:hypothetical protein